MHERRKAVTGTFLLIRKVSTSLIKGSLKIISFQYLHMLKRLQRSRHNEVKKERAIKAWLGYYSEWYLWLVGLDYRRAKAAGHRPQQRRRFRHQE